MQVVNFLDHIISYTTKNNQAINVSILYKHTLKILISYDT